MAQERSTAGACRFALARAQQSPQLAVFDPSGAEVASFRRFHRDREGLGRHGIGRWQAVRSAVRPVVILVGDPGKAAADRAEDVAGASDFGMRPHVDAINAHRADRTGSPVAG